MQGARPDQGSINSPNPPIPDNVRILYYNARSLLPKIDELSAAIEAYDFPAMLYALYSLRWVTMLY